MCYYKYYICYELLICAGILVPSDEFEYWVELSNSGNKLDVKERAQAFSDTFHQISKDFVNLNGLEVMDVLEVVEVCQDTLDEVWRQTEHKEYPEHRMKHLLGVIGE